MARLEGYVFGRDTVDGQEHTRNLIVLTARVVSDWWREDLDEGLDELPGPLVLDVGAHGQLRPDPVVPAALERRGVLRRNGELDERTTAAALQLTC